MHRINTFSVSFVFSLGGDSVDIFAYVRSTYSAPIAYADHAQFTFVWPSRDRGYCSCTTNGLLRKGLSRVLALWACRVLGRSGPTKGQPAQEPRGHAILSELRHLGFDLPIRPRSGGRNTQRNDHTGRYPGIPPALLSSGNLPLLPKSPPSHENHLVEVFKTQGFTSESPFLNPKKVKWMSSLNPCVSMHIPSVDHLLVLTMVSFRFIQCLQGFARHSPTPDPAQKAF